RRNLLRDVVDQPRELLGLVFLQKMPAMANGGVRLTFGSGNARLEYAVAAARNRVVIGKGCDERFVEALEHAPGLFAFGDRRVGVRDWYQRRKLPRTCLIAFVGEGRVIGAFLGVVQ